MEAVIDLLRNLPRPLKYLGLIFLFTPVMYVLARALGLQRYWWLFLLGMILIVVVLWAFDKFVKGQDESKGKAFEGELRREGEKVGASKQEVRQAVKELSQKWAEAAVSLRTSGLSLYALPWYLLIGEPQSGKSTTLKNSGLEFPVGNEALSGTGGTRNCDWWFANEAVILDTAGRFTFQEENAPDSAEWSTFLKLLKKHRRACPVNGVLVVVPCTSLLEDTPEEMDKKAQNIRTKLLHLQRSLEIRFPVFIMITKGDRILGFSEFFSKLDPIAQRQLVGWSTPQGPDKAYDEAVFEASYANIVTRVHKQRLRFLAGDDTSSSVDRFFVFPEELAALKEPLKRYLNGIFQTTRYDEPFAFRGYYLSSGVQQGKPIAQAMRGLLTKGAGSTDDVIENLESIFKKSRAFFIKDFYEKKVFPEQGLISRTKAAEKRERQTLLAVRLLTAAVILLFLGGMLPAWIGLKTLLNPIRDTMTRVDKCGKAPTPCTVTENYKLSRELHDHREKVRKKGWVLALFLKGSRSNELSSLLLEAQRKLYLGGVVQPLISETEGRMALLDWDKSTDYARDYQQSFLDGLMAYLTWRGHQNPPPVIEGQPPLVVPKDLRVKPFVAFCQNPLVKGLEGAGNPKLTKEIEDWVADTALGDWPDQLLADVVDKETPEQLRVTVPEPKRPVAKFDDFWTVARLARWDFKLQTLLAKYVGLYTELTGIQDPEYVSYLKRYVDSGRKLDDCYKELTNHLSALRQGEKGFPGTRVEDWQKYLRLDYERLMKYERVAPDLINDKRRVQLESQLKVDWDNLQSQLRAYAYLLDTTGERPKWSIPATKIQALLAGDILPYADLDAWKLTDDGKLLEKVVQRSPLDAVKDLADFQKRQSDRRASFHVTDVDAASPPDPFRWSTVKPFAEQSADLALLARTLPIAQSFFEDKLLRTCPPGLCYTPSYARPMVDTGNDIVSFATTRPVISRPDVKGAVERVSSAEKDYLIRYIDQLAPRGLAGGGGASFGFPYNVERNCERCPRSWGQYQSAIATWAIVRGGGAAPAPAAETSGQLTAQDFAAWSAKNAYLSPTLDYYKSHVEGPKQRAAAAASAPSQANPALVAAAQAFQTVVAALPGDQPQKAWKQLGGQEGGAGLRAFHSFSRNSAVRGTKQGPALKHFVEDWGAHLLRDAVQPIFDPKEAPLRRRLGACCTGKFPFVTQAQVQQDRSRYYRGEAFRGGGGSAYRLDLPTIGREDISGVLAEVGDLVDEFALEPILHGEEPEFDFVGANKTLLSVASGWERFVLGSAGSSGVPGAGAQTREHRIEVLVLDRPASEGKRFIGERVGAVTLFDRGTRLRPSTDKVTGQIPPPYVWKLGSSDSLLVVSGKNEDSGEGWTSQLEIVGGPLRFFYFARMASEDRREGMDDKVWTIKIQIPDPKNPRTPLEGVFELRLDAPMPGILP